jgi:hypothetical protein
MGCGSVVWLGCVARFPGDSVSDLCFGASYVIKSEVMFVVRMRGQARGPVDGYF